MRAEAGLWCIAGRRANRRSLTIYLSPHQSPELCVLSGPDRAIGSLAAELDSRGMRNKRIRTSHAFHSSMMDPAVAALRSVLAGITLSAPQRAVVSTVTGRLLSADEATDPEYWARQLRETGR